MVGTTFLSELLLIFILSAVIVYLFDKIKIPSVVGFLLSGVLLGPHGLSVIHEPHTVEVLAEIGVIVLLFTVGLEFSITKISQLAKVVFDELPERLPPLGELAEVTVMLPGLSPAPAIPNAAIRRVDGKLGVWRVEGGSLGFIPIVPGRGDLDGMVQVREGLKAGERVVVYSKKALNARSRIKVVDSIARVTR